MATTQTDPRTATRIPLTRERVLAAAVALADEEGIDALTMRRLGQELGVEAMSLYNHVDNKEDILTGMVDTVVAEIDPPIENADWKTTLRTQILAARKTMLRHPWASAVMVTRRQMTPTVMGYFNRVTGILRNGGFSVDLTHHAMHVLGSRILGFVQELYDDEEALAESPEIVAIMMQRLSVEYPYLAEMATEVSHEGDKVGTGCDTQWEFEFALDLVLDGLERIHEVS